MKKIKSFLLSAALAIGNLAPCIADAAPTLRPRGFLKLDLNYDGIIDAVDASIILSEYTKLSTGNDYSLSVTDRYLADYDNNHIIDAVDSSNALAVYAYNSTHGEDDVYEERYLRFSVYYKRKNGLIPEHESDGLTYEECLEMIEAKKQDWRDGNLYNDIEIFEIGVASESVQLKYSSNVVGVYKEYVTTNNGHIEQINFVK